MLQQTYIINTPCRLIGIRLQNIYDVNNKTFLFKFAKVIW